VHRRADIRAPAKRRPVQVLDLRKLAGEQIEQQPVVGLPVDEMALPLPADETKSELLGAAPRDVVLDDPGVDCMQSEIPERESQKPRRRDAPPAPAAEGLVSRNDPESPGSHVAVDVGESDDANWGVVRVRGIQPDEVGLTLHHDLEQRRRDALPTAAEIEPLVILLALQPGRGQLEVRKRAERPERHVEDSRLRSRAPADPGTLRRALPPHRAS